MTPGDEWLHTLTAQRTYGNVPDPAPLSPAEALRRMRRLAVPAEDRADLLATLPGPGRDPEAWRALLACHRTLFATPATPPPQVDWPDPPTELGAAGRYFYLHLCLLALPLALERQRRRGVPADVVEATLADVGGATAAYRLGHGTGGFDRQRWVLRHFRGTLHRLGRLQFERTVLDPAAVGGLAGPGGPAPGERVLGVHIPGDGRLTPQLCDASFRAARDFYARHFPDEPYRFLVCSSWLLDDRLAAHLPADANILRFQRRFTPFGDRSVSDDSVLEFVFRTPPGTADLTLLPQRTTLQRALVQHLLNGGHWHVAHGWARITP